MSDDGFANAVTRLLVEHREKPTEDFSTWRNRLTGLIAVARAKADERRARPHREFAELLAVHAPYNNPSQRLVIQCPTCIDGHGGGIYASTAEWARHVEIELSRAQLRVMKVPR